MNYSNNQFNNFLEDTHQFLIEDHHVIEDVSTQAEALPNDDSNDLPMHRLSSEHLDDFEFTLDEDGERLFSDSKGSAAGFESIIEAMDCQSGDLLENSLDQMPIEAIQESEMIQLPSYRTRRRNQRDRSPSPQQAKKRFQLHDTVNFDPPAREVITQQQPYQRRPSHSDLSMCSSHATDAQCSMQSSTTTMQPYITESQYNEALQNLAESMKRSGESRRVVAMMQRRMLSPEQRQALAMAKEQLQKENYERFATMAAQQQTTQMQEQEEMHQSSIMGNLFSGNGLLGQGRRQLGMYMSQVNHQTM